MAIKQIELKNISYNFICIQTELRDSISLKVNAKLRENLHTKFDPTGNNRKRPTS